ncbi:MAG: hypothetical protein LBR11_12315 [Deltaproteobacteria bacterium]|jgi:hypothetical protein|nr:hypothetical protein [Deltaproteobacteria bacterium]
MTRIMTDDQFRALAGLGPEIWTYQEGQYVGQELAKNLPELMRYLGLTNRELAALRRGPDAGLEYWSAHLAMNFISKRFEGKFYTIHWDKTTVTLKSVENDPSYPDNGLADRLAWKLEEVA